MTKEQQIQKAAITLAKSIGFINLTRNAISAEAGISDGSFQMYTGMKYPEFLEWLKPQLPASCLKHPLTKSRATRDERKTAIMECAVTLAEEKGYKNISPTELSDAAGVCRTSVLSYIGTKAQLQQAILRLAILRRNLVIISQAVVNREEKIPDDLRQEALAYIACGY